MPSSYQTITETLPLSRANTPPRLVISYIFDWLVLIAVAVVAFVLGNLDPNKRPFSLTDPDISFPFTEHETVPLYLLLILCAAVPIVIIPIVVLIFVPGKDLSSYPSRSAAWREKLWEIHAGWLGLLSSLVTIWFFTQTMKNLFGKPRPDLLARCDPDYANIEKYTVVAHSKGQLVSASICQQKDMKKLNDGFCSYPSGHSSASAAGLVYLSLFLFSKFRVGFPSYPSMRFGDIIPPAPKASRTAAAPPIYLAALGMIPFCLSVFITSSRWFDFRHHGFDILFGYLMGTVVAFASFRMYHMPISTGYGVAWGPRSRGLAFWAGVGVPGFANNNMVQHSHPDHQDGQAMPSFNTEYRSHTQPHVDQDIEMQRV